MVKKAMLTVAFEKEKLDALQFYIGKKETDLQTELADTMTKLYEKHVPQPTREYIEDRLLKDAKPAPSAQKPVAKPPSSL